MSNENLNTTVAKPKKVVLGNKNKFQAKPANELVLNFM